MRVTDVSQRGVGFAHDGEFHPGMHVMILLEDGRERRGVVRWSTDQNAGMMLVEPLADLELEETGPHLASSPEGRA